MLTCKELVARKVKALQSPLTMWLLDFTLLLYVNTVILRDKCANINIPGLIQHVTLYWYIIKSIVSYESYLAECPGLSAHPSPPMESKVP